MKIKWINHAGFLLESGNIKLVSDPWIEGTAFDNGWKLLSPTLFDYNDFEDVTHIWFSHEHPDHFSPANIKKIPPPFRAKITVIYQTTDDKKVVEFCRKADFKEIIELPPSKWFALDTDFKVMNQNDRDGDSWLAINTEGVSILNLNDVVSYQSDLELKRLKQQIGDIDILLTQFSYANWVGNQADTDYREQCAKEKYTATDNQIRIFKPRYVIPFASYVWFCHEENYYMNHEANKIGDFHQWLKGKDVTSIVMYPNDEWTVGQPFDADKAIEKYNKHYIEVDNKTDLIHTQSVDMDTLKALATKYVARISSKNGWVIKQKLKNPALIYLTDDQKTFQLTLEGLKEIVVPSNECDIVLTSAALAYCFKFEWGGATLTVNGRFEKPKKGNFTHIENYFYIANLNNMGKSYSLMRIAQNATRRLREKMNV